MEAYHITISSQNGSSSQGTASHEIHIVWRGYF